MGNFPKKSKNVLTPNNEKWKYDGLYEIKEEISQIFFPLSFEARKSVIFIYTSKTREKTEG
jgi:hypothetical protein